MESLEKIRDLFQDEELRARVLSARTQEEALGVVVMAGARREIDFTADSLQRLVEVHAGPRTIPTLSELVEVSGAGLRRAEGTHVHMSCCTDCPSSAALCCK